MISIQALGAYASLQITILLIAATLFLDLRRTSRRRRLVRTFTTALGGCCTNDYAASPV
jgi:hypothetical protein